MNDTRNKQRTAAPETLPPDVAAALDHILWFYWVDEIENFIADEPEPDTPHIFRSIAVVDGWFEDHTATAEELVRSLYDEPQLAIVTTRVDRFRGGLK